MDWTALLLTLLTLYTGAWVLSLGTQPQEDSQAGPIPWGPD